MRIIGNIDKGFEFVEKIIKDKKSRDYLSVLTAAYNIFGLLLLEKDKPEPSKSIPYFEKALKTLEEFTKTLEAQNWLEGTKEFYGRIFNNLGLAYERVNDYDSSLKFYKKSLQIKKKIGDLIGICQTSANIAVLFYKFNKRKNYYFWKKKVEELSQKYRLVFQRAYLLRRIGTISCERGKLKYGLPLLKEDLSLYQTMEGAKFGIQLTIETIDKYKPEGSLA